MWSVSALTINPQRMTWLQLLGSTLTSFFNGRAGSETHDSVHWKWLWNIGGELIMEAFCRIWKGQKINNVLHVLMYQNYVCKADFGLFNHSFPVNSNVFLLPVTRPLQFMPAVTGCEDGRRPRYVTNPLQGTNPFSYTFIQTGYLREKSRSKSQAERKPHWGLLHRELRWCLFLQTAMSH